MGLSAGPWLEEAVRRGLIDPAQLLPQARSIQEKVPESLAELPHDISERDFQWAIIEVAEENGWTFYHTYNSRRCVAGFPDLVLVRNGVLIFSELKVGKNKTTAAQERWLDALAAVPGVRVRRWRPEHWSAIREELTCRQEAT